MKKLYPKFLFLILLILLSFSFVQKVLAEEVNVGGNSISEYGQITAPWPKDPSTILSRAVLVLIVLPLALFSITTIVTFLYLKLRKKAITKIRSLLRLGGLSLLTIAFLGLTLLQLKNLDYSLSLTNAMLDDKIFSISAALSVVSLLVFIYCLIRTVARFVATKLKKKTLP